MAAKTRVDGNRVTMDDLIYEVKPAGDGYHSVHDEFGNVLGYLRVRGKTIIPEDYKVDGAPPVMQIGRLWGAVHLENQKAAPPVSKGVCQVSIHEAATDAQLESARLHRAWLKKQPGLKTSYLARDPATGKAMSISIWQTRAHLDAAQAATDAEGTALAASSVEIFPFVEEP